MKATFHCLNLFNFDVTAEAMVAECWMPLYDIPQVYMSKFLDLIKIIIYLLEFVST